MSTLNQTTSSVLQAASRLVDAFSSHDTDTYFSTFSDEATFVFHSLDRVLHSKAEYRNLWAQWELDGFRVLDCKSSQQHVSSLGDGVAVFTHCVDTRLLQNGHEQRFQERETIVFKLTEEGWRACHEHLSPLCA